MAWPKGRPRLAHVGRKAGTPNHSTAEIKALAAQYGPKALAELARLAHEAESEQTRVAAITALLDRGYGKPTATLEAGPALTKMLLAWADD